MATTGRDSQQGSRTAMSAECERVNGFGQLEDGLQQAGDWYLWGPYVRERQWGTVREDYSADGEAWNYLRHDAVPSIFEIIRSIGTEATS